MIPKLIGVAGYAGAGKDTLGDVLVRGLGYIKFSFSDALYLEVSEAFSIAIDYLRDRDHKEKPTPLLALRRCQDLEFVAVVNGALGPDFTDMDAAHAPREILQWWGTEYRRRQDPDYWVKRARDFYHRELTAGAPGLVNCSVRFLNECAWIHDEGGIVVRVTRPGIGAVNAHVSDKPLPAELVDIEIDNDAAPNDLLSKLTQALNDKAA